MDLNTQFLNYHFFGGASRGRLIRGSTNNPKFALIRLGSDPSLINLATNLWIPLKSPPTYSWDSGPSAKGLAAAGRWENFDWQMGFSGDDVGFFWEFYGVLCLTSGILWGFMVNIRDFMRVLWLTSPLTVIWWWWGLIDGNYPLVIRHSDIENGHLARWFTMKKSCIFPSSQTVGLPQDISTS